jgi:hypothetical protein
MSSRGFLASCRVSCAGKLSKAGLRLDRRTFRVNAGGRIVPAIHIPDPRRAQKIEGDERGLRPAPFGQKRHEVGGPLASCGVRTRRESNSELHCLLSLPLYQHLSAPFGYDRYLRNTDQPLSLDRDGFCLIFTTRSSRRASRRDARSKRSGLQWQVPPCGCSRREPLAGLLEAIADALAETLALRAVR